MNKVKKSYPQKIVTAWQQSIMITNRIFTLALRKDTVHMKIKL